MVIQPYEIYRKWGRLDFDLSTYDKIVKSIESPVARRVPQSLISRNATESKIISICDFSRASVSPEVVDLYTFLRLDGDNEILSYSDQELAYESFAFHADKGNMERLKNSYENIFGK